MGDIHCYHFYRIVTTKNNSGNESSLPSFPLGHNHNNDRLIPKRKEFSSPELYVYPMKCQN